MKRILWVGAGIIPILVLISQTAMADISVGMQAARNDWSSGAGYHPSCEDHGYTVTDNPGFCLSFKTDYILQWNFLQLAK